jgi:arylsulfatase
MVFDSYDMSNVLFKTGKPLRDKWFYFTEAELSPGAVRVGQFKAVFNTRGDNGALAGSDMPGQQLGWRGDESYVATVPAVYNLWQDPQERYDIFMNSWTEKTWTIPIFNKAIQDLMKSYVQYPPRPLQSEVFTGPMNITRFRTIQEIKKLMDEKGLSLPDLGNEN